MVEAIQKGIMPPSMGMAVNREFMGISTSTGRKRARREAYWDKLELLRLMDFLCKALQSQFIKTFNGRCTVAATCYNVIDVSFTVAEISGCGEPMLYTLSQLYCFFEEQMREN
ncbi:hypothetical protein VNO77_36172 [Canavalia gladiata]|uniref:Uncharacterized protein n=1 Tax=Canavalia gladiata TaxID=3824 RepID=A0AAN9K9G8_CANGL